MMRAGNYLERSERDQALHKQRRRCAHGQRGDGKMKNLRIPWLACDRLGGRITENCACSAINVAVSRNAPEGAPPNAPARKASNPDSAAAASRNTIPSNSKSGQLLRGATAVTAIAAAPRRIIRALPGGTGKIQQEAAQRSKPRRHSITAVRCRGEDHEDRRISRSRKDEAYQSPNHRAALRSKIGTLTAASSKAIEVWIVSKAVTLLSQQYRLQTHAGGKDQEQGDAWRNQRNPAELRIICARALRGEVDVDKNPDRCVGRERDQRSNLEHLIVSWHEFE